jgi:hypothetical protein
MRRKHIPRQPSEIWCAEVETQPLPVLRGLAFRAFLARYELSRLDVALAAGVRLLTVWNIERDNPVSRQQAALVYAGLYRLTGVQYRGRIMLHMEYKRLEMQARVEQKQPMDGLRKIRFL